MVARLSPKVISLFGKTTLQTCNTTRRTSLGSLPTLCCGLIANNFLRALSEYENFQMDDLEMKNDDTDSIEGYDFSDESDDQGAAFFKGHNHV